MKPSYTEWHPQPEQTQASRVLVISPEGREGSATIRQDAEVWLLKLRARQTVTHELRPGRHAWLHVAEGEISLNGHPMKTGDGAAISGETSLTVSAEKSTQVLLFDLK